MNSHQRRYKLRLLLKRAEVEILSAKLTGRDTYSSNQAADLIDAQNIRHIVRGVNGVEQDIIKDRRDEARHFNWLLVGRTTKLPYGLREIGSKKWNAKCRICENEYEWEHKVSMFDFRFSYCGGSPRCCP